MPKLRRTAWYRLFRVYLIFAHHARSDYEQLRLAYYEHLLDIRPETDLPEALRDEFRRIMAKAGMLMISGKESSEHTVEQVRALADALRDLYFSLRQVNIEVRRRADRVSRPSDA